MAKKPTSLRAAMAALKPRIEVVRIDELPEPITIKAPSLAHRMLIGTVYRELEDNPALANQRANAIGICAAAHGADGQRLYDPENDADVEEVINLAPHVQEALVAALGRVNGYVAKAAETAEKNSRTSRKG